MKLELKHIAPYLPYGVHLMNEYGRWHNTTLNKSLSIYKMLDMKPILRPISDLFNGKHEDILDEFSEVSLEAFKISFLSELRPINAFDKINYTIATKLFENHFDVFGLIEQNLAIDINTI